MSILYRRQGPYIWRPQLDRGHPLCSQLVGAWSSAHVKGSTPSTVEDAVPELVRGNPEDGMGEATAGNAVAKFTPCGLAIENKLWSWLQPSAELRPTDRLSMFWYGVITGNNGGTNEAICGQYHNTVNFPPFHSYCIWRPNNTDVGFSCSSGGAFTSITATNIISSADYNSRMMSLAVTYGISAVLAFQNGRQVQSGAGVSGLTYDTSSKFVFDFNPASSAAAGAATVLCLVWRRELSPAEHAALAIDPFQIFLPQSPQWWLSNRAIAAPGRGAKGGGNNGKGKGGGGKNVIVPLGACLMNIGNPGVDF